MTTIPFSGSTIALIVRYKKSATDHPGVLDQHADCILDGGSPIGFFGELVASDVVNLVPLLWGPVGLPVTIGAVLTKPQRITGFVYTYSRYQAQRPHYVSTASARAAKCVSGILTINVSSKEATDFRACWAGMLANPDSFAYAGNNCSTHAARAFARAGICSPEIPGLDTPDHLFDLLKAARPSGWKEYFGYLGFTPQGAGTNDMAKSFIVEVDAA